MPLPNDTEVYYVDSLQEAMEMIQWVKDNPHNRDILAFDLETTGLDPRDPGANIRLAQLGDYHTAWCVPWKWWAGAFMQALAAWDGEYAGHNVSFDNRWLMIFADWKPPYHRIHDTMIMAQVCEPDLGAGLKALGDRHIDRRASAGQQILKESMKEQGWDWSTIPTDFETYWLYGGLDTIITAHLFDHYRAHEKYPKSYELEMNARRVVSAMEDNGVRIDIPYCEEQIETLAKYVEECKSWAQDNWGISITSPDQLRTFFGETLGQEFKKFSEKTGKPSVDIEQLTAFAEGDDPLAAQCATFIVSTRKAEKKANSYFKNFLKFNHDGILHTSFKTLQARTGRMSSTAPALQTISKQDPVLRDAFLPHEGEVLLSCDYSQVELRLMCHFSGDEKLIHAFRTADETGGDFFVEMGKAIYSDPNFTKKDPRRNLIKTFMYAYLYGAGVAKMAKSAGVPESEMKQFVDTLAQTYPGIPAFQKRITELGESRERDEGQGYVVTPFGRRIPCDKGQARTLVNYLLQGHAAEVLKEALVKMDAAGLTQYLLLPIHDEVIASVPLDKYDEISQQIGEIMSVRGKYAVDLIADPEGPFNRWGDKVRVK